MSVLPGGVLSSFPRLEGVAMLLLSGGKDLNWTLLPKDSLLQDWCRVLSTTEVPFSYQVACGISLIGALCKRNIWIDQQPVGGVGWKVYPNQSVMLVGPSGIGKDTAINFVQRQLEKLGTIPIIGGRTIETIYQRLITIGDPAAAYLPIGELTSFLGGKDYQKSMTQEITNLLSSNESVDISTKGDLAFGGPKIIKRPTITMHCGSTVEWLHKAMPDGALEGGFMGRFLIIVESLGGRQVPLLKYEVSDQAEKASIRESNSRWNEMIVRLINKASHVGEMILTEDAVHTYENWYHNRFKLFSKATFPYANRSRDTVLRLAMLMALTREHWGWVDEVDVRFGTKLLSGMASRIDDAVVPPTLEAQAAKDILGMLPCEWKQILKELGRKYNIRLLQSAETLLLGSCQIAHKNDKVIRL